MPDPKKKSSIQKVYNQLKLKNDEEIANQKKDELNQFKKGYTPSSNKYKKQLQDLKDKEPQITQDNSIKKDRDFNKKYHDDKEWDDKKWGYYENAATVAELGNFVPHPAAQVVGKVGSLASAALAARKAKLEYDKGNYLNAGLNAGLGLFSASLGAKTGINTVKASKLNSLERAIAPREFVSNISNGVEVGRIHYNVPNYLNVIANNNPNVLKNRIALGIVGTDAVTDFKDPEAIKYAEGGFLNSNPPINGYKDHTVFQKYVTDPLRSNPNYSINSDRLLNVKDTRKINATSGKRIDPNKDLMSGKYSEQLIADITKEAVKQGVDPHTAIAISLQETNLGRRDGNVGHVLNKYGTGDPIYDMVSSLKQSQEKAKSLGLKNENDVLQTYNGRGKIFPNTEQGYHGFKMKQIYGVDLPAEGIDMRKNPLYGKRIIDLRENIVKQNPTINTIVNNKGLSVDPFTTTLNTYAEGGQINNQLDIKYNNYLNNNMKQYAQGGQLTHFNEGGTHESNPNGGIPLGNNASVEQGETKKGNYVYSDRLYINEDLVKQFNLPNSIKGKTFANASKVIEKPFKDKNSNPDRATQKEHLDRLKEAQEALKEQEAKMQQSMQANSQEIPDQMNGEIPEGMEQFIGQEPQQPQQFAGGGYYDTNNPYGFTNPGQQSIQGPYNQVPIGVGSPAGLTPIAGATMSAPTNMGTSAGLPESKGMGSAASFGNVMGGIGVANSLAQGDTTGALIGGASLAASNGLLGAGAQGAMGAAGTGLGVLGAAQGAMALGALSQGKGASKNKGTSMASGAMTGAMAGAGFGPGGAAIGAGVGAVAGLAGSGKAAKAEAEQGRSNVRSANSIFNDKSVVAAYGGPLPIVNPFKKIASNAYNTYGNPISQGTLDNNELTNSLVTQYKTKNPVGPVSDPSLNNFTNNFGEPARFDKVAPTTTPNVPGKPGFFQRAGNYLKENQGEIMRLAPVGMNALQLAKLKRPGQVSLNRLSNTYKPGYIDEAGIQNRLDSENQNTINALTNSSGGSEASLRAGILGSQAARLRARGDAYAGIQQYNNGQDAIAQNFKLGIDQANLQQANLQQDINDKNQGNYDTQKYKLLGQIGTDLGNIGKEKVFAKKAGQMFGYDENGKYIITPEGKKSYIEKEDATKNVAAFGGYLRTNKKGY